MNAFIEQALMAPLSVLAGYAAAIFPNLVAMSILLLVGLLVARAAGFLAERLLRVLGFDHLCNRVGVTAALLRAGVKTDPSRLIGRGLHWAVVLVTSVAAVGALNLTPVNQVAHSLLAYVPRLITASMILLAGYVASNFASQAILIAAVNAGLAPARLLATCSRWGLQLLAVAMALEQLGIAEQIVVVGFGITWGGLVLAAAIAFGFGAKDLAKTFLEKKLLPPRADMPDDLRHW